MPKRAIATQNAPRAVGPYSQAVVANGFVFISGQIPINPATGKLVDSPDLSDHVRRVMDNISEILKAAGSCLENAVKTTIYLSDIVDFLAFNEAYAAYFSESPPARATVQVGALPLGALVEIDMIALTE